MYVLAVSFRTSLHIHDVIVCENRAHGNSPLFMIHDMAAVSECETGYLLCDSTTHTHVYDVTASSSYLSQDYGHDARLSCLDNQAGDGTAGKRINNFPHFSS